VCEKATPACPQFLLPIRLPVLKHLYYHYDYLPQLVFFFLNTIMITGPQIFLIMIMITNQKKKKGFLIVIVPNPDWQTTSTSYNDHIRIDLNLSTLEV
jgi:hypothetical protein